MGYGKAIRFNTVGPIYEKYCVRLMKRRRSEEKIGKKEIIPSSPIQFSIVIYPLSIYCISCANKEEEEVLLLFFLNFIIYLFLILFLFPFFILHYYKIK